MNIKIRKRQLTQKGRYALFLDIYHDKRQWQENLKLYLENEKGDPLIKQQNKETLAIAERQKIERLHQLQNNIFGFKTKSMEFKSFNEFFKTLKKEREKTGVSLGCWLGVYNHIESYNPNISFSEIDERFLENFKAYLLTKIKVNSASQYFHVLKHVIHEAYRKKLIMENPCERVKSIKMVSTNREFLTLDEVKRLFKVECRYKVLKKAFLFSCFTGLRFSDVHKLTWKEVRKEDEQEYIIFTQKKTKNAEKLPLSKIASEILGNERGDDDEKVFKGLNYCGYMNFALLEWMVKADIKKHITYHSSRHSYAILLLNSDVDIYTVSKLLGHAELKTTSIYAKVLTEKKINAVNKLPIFEI